MGNKNKNKKKASGGGDNNGGSTNQPFVTICTPTYNRRPFIPYMIKCFEHQTYPKSKLEWIIVDDGTDKIEELVKDIPQVKYYKYDTKMPLGKKRNLMHQNAKGDIIVYMDDDDYYPPVRIEHAVNMLLTHPKALCAGASEIYIYFKHINQMIQFGPYGPNHATAGTFAFKKELLKDHRYNDEAALAEEKGFLKDYTVPFVQLEPKKTILVFSHIHNTFDKKTLLDNRHPKFVRDSDKTVDDFVKEPELKDFYMNQIEVLLKDYQPGRPEMKPDVLKQIEEIKVEREKMAKEMQKKQIDNIQIPPEQKQMMIQMALQQPEMFKEQIKQQSGMNDEQFEMFKNNLLNSQGQTQIGKMNGENGKGEIVIERNGEKKVLNNDEIVSIIKQQQEHINNIENKLRESENKMREPESKMREPDSKMREPESILKDSERKLKEAESKLRESQSNLRESESKLREGESKLRDFESKLRDIQKNQSNNSFIEIQVNGIKKNLTSEEILLILRQQQELIKKQQEIINNF